MLFAIFLVKCAKQRQDSKWFMLSFAWQYQNSQAYERNHYSRTFLVIALVKQKVSNRLKCWSSLFADILLHYGARSSRAEMFWSSKCDGGTRSAGDPKTLTPGPWTSPTDQVHGPPHGPVHGPPIRTTPTDPLKKFNRKKKNKK